MRSCQKAHRQGHSSASYYGQLKSGFRHSAFCSSFRDVLCHCMILFSPKDNPNVDGVLAGFPCQRIFGAGNQQGLADPRSALLAEVFRVADEVTTSWPHWFWSAKHDGIQVLCTLSAEALGRILTEHSNLPRL